MERTATYNPKVKGLNKDVGEVRVSESKDSLGQCYGENFGIQVIRKTVEIFWVKVRSTLSNRDQLKIQNEYNCLSITSLSHSNQQFPKSSTATLRIFLEEYRW